MLYKCLLLASQSAMLACMYARMCNESERASLDFSLVHIFFLELKIGKQK